MLFAFAIAVKIGLDPAVMAAPFISTIVDVLSLLIYFQFATAALSDEKGVNGKRDAPDTPEEGIEGHRDDRQRCGRGSCG